MLSEVLLDKSQTTSWLIQFPLESSHAVLADVKILSRLRAQVTKNETILKIRGKCRKMNFAHIVNLGRPFCPINHHILCLPENRFVFGKIDNKWKPPKYLFEGSKFMASSEGSRE